MKKTSEIQKQIGNQIKRYRKKTNMSQEELAELIGIATNSLSNIECGNSFMTSKTLEKILNIFKISAKELFDFPENPDTEIDKRAAILSFIDEIENNEKKMNLAYMFLKNLI